ncbi:MAG: hypothetical protein ABIQ16_04575 [Polyangiaceae bacterium]
MNQGRAGWLLGCGLLSMAAVGCGSSDGSSVDAAAGAAPKMGPATDDCGTVQQPLELTLKDVKPALGSSVPNANVVQSFTIAGKLLKIDPSFGRAAAHTAGAPIPATVSWTYGASGADTVYTTLPMTWTTAPGHVELTPPGLLVTADGCVSVLPTPTFSYDITAP